MPLIPEILFQNEYFNGKQKQKQKTTKKKKKTHTHTQKQKSKSGIVYLTKARHQG